MSKEITVREWIKKFNNGDFDKKDRTTQIEAGWFDWFCNKDSLSKRLKKMGNVIKEIKNDYILDNYYLWFKNNCPCEYPLYDDVRFEPIDEEKRDQMFFIIKFDHPFCSKYMYEIITARNNYNVEFQCKNKSQVLKIVNQLGTDLPNSLVDKSEEITENEKEEMLQLTKQLKEISKDAIRTGLKGKTKAMSKAKSDFVNFFDEHQFYQLKDKMWKDFQDYYDSLVKGKDLNIGGIYNYEEDSFIIIVSETSYLTFYTDENFSNNQDVNTYIRKYYNLFKFLDIKNLDLNKISGYLGKISEDVEEKIYKLIN